MITGAVLLGDSAYATSEWLIPPLAHAAVHTQQQYYFNYAHTHTRFIAECGIGLLKTRFRPLHYGLRVRDMAFAVRVIKAAVVLHNICMSYNPLGADEIRAMLDEPHIGENGGAAAADGDEQDQPNNTRRNTLIQSFPHV
jgi:hypothetical protein